MLLSAGRDRRADRPRFRPAPGDAALPRRPVAHSDFHRATRKRVAAIAAKHGDRSAGRRRYNGEGVRDPAAQPVTLGAWEIAALEDHVRASLAGSLRITMFDKFHDECGVVAIYGHPEAAKLAYLGLYALQHRGQESAGICTSDGDEISLPQVHGPRGRYLHQRGAQPRCPASWPSATRATPPPAIPCCCNAQPFSVACNKGRIAVAHNGNITNAAELRAELERRGSIFQASSDTEVILHLVAHSSERTLAGALREALLQLEGAFSLVFLAAGPHHRGARSARLPPAGRRRDGALGRAQVLRVRLRNLRLRPDRRGLPGRRRARRDGDRRARRA